MRILIAEDQPELRRMLVKNLTAAGYTVDGVPDGAEALAYLDAAAYDAAVLDIMMPKVDGLTVLRTLRARGSALPVLLLTARDAVADRVDGLDAGADDYLIKPFALDELLARLRVLTRKKGSGSTNVYTLADLTVDTAARTAKRGGRTLELSAREYALLEYLIRSKGVVLSRQQIEDSLWSLDYAGGTNVVDVYISYLRKKLEGVLDVPFDRICAHEFVASAPEGLRALDIAKALLDRGFHAPTVYFPLIVHECLMAEPTETESKQTLDAYIEALREIVALGKSDPQQLLDAPVKMPVRRLDETAAARHMILTEDMA